MKARGRGMWMWLKLHVYILRVLGGMVERIERLEAAAFHGHPVETVYVPDGMSVEAAWRSRNNGKVLTGERKFVLTDHSGNNMLKVLN